MVRFLLLYEAVRRNVAQRLLMFLPLMATGRYLYASEIFLWLYLFAAGRIQVQLLSTDAE
jgi:hypothetical protein